MILEDVVVLSNTHSKFQLVFNLHFLIFEKVGVDNIQYHLILNPFIQKCSRIMVFLRILSA